MRGISTFVNDYSNIEVMLYPHGATSNLSRSELALQIQRKREREELYTQQLADANSRVDRYPTDEELEANEADQDLIGYDAQGQAVFAPISGDDVTVVGRRGRYAKLARKSTYPSDGGGSYVGSEGASALRISSFITSLDTIRMMEAPYHSAVMILSITAHQLHTLMGGTANLQARLVYRDKDFRNICTGAWLTIKGELHNSDLSFFGCVSAVSVVKASIDGVERLTVQVQADSFYSPVLRAEIKQTLSKDESLADISNSAIMATGDYSEGFLKALIKDFALASARPPASFLKDVLASIVTVDLPTSLVQGAEELTLGEAIQVCDGSVTSASRYGLAGSDADVIKGKLINSYQGSQTNNINHAGVIEQMFRPLSVIMEYYATFIPISQVSDEYKAELAKRSARLYKLYIKIGGVPLIVYRYAPVYPLAPPTQEGLVFAAAQRKADAPAFLDGSIAVTIAEQFFGEMPRVAPTFEAGQKGQVLTLNSDEYMIMSMTYNTTEDDHINYVFMEQVFTNGQAQDHNLARNNVRPTLNKRDINRHGLRSYSAHTPMIATGTDDQEKRDFNIKAAEALAERIYHTVGMGHQFCDGSLVLVAVSEQPPPIKVGTWIRVREQGLDVTDFNALYFTCYVTNITVNVQGGAVPKHTHTVSFIRGHYGVMTAEYDAVKVSAEIDLNDNYLEQLNGDTRLV